MKLIFLDLETTGLDPRNDDIIQVAYQVEGEKKIFSQIYKPTKTIPYEVSGITNIDQSDVIDKELFVETQDYKDFKKLAEDGYIAVAHNTEFDLSFLKNIGIDFNQSICTLMIAKKMIGQNLQNHKLGTIRAFYHIPVPKDNHAHNAEYDVEVLKAIFDKMRQDFNSLDDMIIYSEQAKKDLKKIWTFGKFNGEKVDKVKHGDYIQWYLNQPENPKYPKDPGFVEHLQSVMSGEVEEEQGEEQFEDGRLF